MDKWISVKDRLPKKNGEYLCYSSDSKTMLTLRFARCLHCCVDKFDFADKHRSGFYEYDGEWGYFEYSGITHWMPLPEPPKGE